MYTIKPGYLVSVKTTLRGGVKYEREDIRNEHKKDGSKEEEWRTVKTVTNEEEFKAAEKQRAKIAALVSSRCKLTPFGLICQEEDIEELYMAKELAELMVDEWNTSAKHTIMTLNVLPVCISTDDERVARDIAKQMRDLAKQMKDAVRAGDVEAIREAAKTAATMKEMFGEEEKARVSLAIKAARDAAKIITKQVIKNKEKIEAVLPTLKLGPISKMRFVFADIPEDGQKKASAKMPVASAKRTATVEIDEE